MASIKINTAAAGDSTIIAAPTSGFLRIQQYVIMSAGSTNVYFANGADSVPLTGPFPFTAQTGVSSGYCKEGLFDLLPAKAFILNNSDSIQLSGHVRYETIR